MPDTPFIQRPLTPAEIFKKSQAQENQEIAEKSITDLIFQLVNITSTMEHCHSLQGISNPSKRKLKKILNVLVEKIETDPYYLNIEKPVKLSSLFILCEDCNDPFALLNYGDNGFLLLRILSLIDEKGFAKVPDYVDHNQELILDIRQTFNDLPH